MRIVWIGSLGFAAAFAAPVAPRDSREPRGSRDPGVQSRPGRFDLPAIRGLVPDPLAEPRPAPRPALAAAAAGIRISFAGAMDSPAGTQRSREEARTLAGALAIASRAKGADFAALARVWSDDPSTADGGFLGTLRPKKDASALERAVVQGAVGGVHGPLETPGGFWIVTRIPCEASAYDAILVSWLGATGGPKGMTRSLGEARERADALAARARSEPARFEDLAASESDDPDAATRKGAVAPLFRGELQDDLEALVRGLAVGAIGGPIETPKGFLVVRRARVDWATVDGIVVRFRGAEGAPLTQVRTREEARERADALLSELRKPDANIRELQEKYGEFQGFHGEGFRRTAPVSSGSAAWLREIAAVAEGSFGVVEAPFGYLVFRRLPFEAE